MAEPDELWMYKWIDEFELNSDEAVATALQSGLALEKLHELALEATKDTSTLLRNPEWTDSTLVAGQGFNLSDENSCGGLACKLREVDDAISKTWHYFDRIVLAGPSPHMLVKALEETPKKAVYGTHRTIINNVLVLNHLRAIGATPRISFRPNNWSIASDDLRQVAVEMGLAAVADPTLRRKIVQQLNREAKVSTKFVNGMWHTRMSHPFLDEPMIARNTKKLSRIDFIEMVFARHNRASVNDYVKARKLMLPLAASVRASWLRGPGQSSASALEERLGRIAFELELPVVKGLRAKDLLLLLEDQRPYFIRFQSALRAAMVEALAKLDSKPDSEVAKAVMRDYIEPELKDIDRRLSSANRNLSKKLAAGVAIGGLTTSVGLIAAMPLVIATGVAAGATVVSQVYKYLDDKSSVELSDMYFLWNLQRSAHK